MKTSLDHLPEAKRERIAAIAALLQAEAPVEMVILFGSYARGDWVEDPENVYFSDFDILAVVATEQQARDLEQRSDLEERAQAIAGRTPVSLIVHGIKEINQELRLGQYFFIDILREGVLLYTSKRFSLASPKALTQADRLQLGLINFRYWFASASEFWRLAGHAAGRNLGPQAAFLLHQAAERYFHTALLVFTGYKPKLHELEKLANQAAPLHPALEGALPRAEPEDERLFDLLRRAYIEARYSKSYRITADELRILRERVRDLAVRVRQACEEKLASFCGPSQVGPLPEVPSPADAGELAEAPSPDDAAAFQAWREALAALAYERGKQEGITEGFDRGKQEGTAEGFEKGQQDGFEKGRLEARREMLIRLLGRAGIPLTEEARARIQACTEPETLDRWLDRAAFAGTLDDVLS
jgi:predicted nucleotidyltransferase/HEPN domain-containing protein